MNNLIESVVCEIHNQKDFLYISIGLQVNLLPNLKRIVMVLKQLSLIYPCNFVVDDAKCKRWYLCGIENIYMLLN